MANRTDNINEVEFATDLAQGMPFSELAEKHDRCIDHVYNIAKGRARPKIKAMADKLRESYMDSLKNQLDSMATRLVKEAYEIAIQKVGDKSQKLKAIELLLDRIVSKATSKLDVTSGGESLVKFIQGINESDI